VDVRDVGAASNLEAGMSTKLDLTIDVAMFVGATSIATVE
jgi:hypothetical protein